MQENFLLPMICIKPPLVGYLGRNNIFNFDQMVLGYVNTMGVGTSRTMGVQGAGVLGVIPPHMNEESNETESFCQCLSRLPVSING